MCFALRKASGDERAARPPPSYVLRPGYVARSPFRSHYKFIRLWHATKRNWILGGFLIRIQIPKQRRGSLVVPRGMGSAYKVQKSKRMTEWPVTWPVHPHNCSAKEGYIWGQSFFVHLPDCVTEAPLNDVEGPRIGCVVDAGPFAIGICAGTGNFNGDIHSTFDVRITGSGNALLCKNTLINFLPNPNILHIEKGQQGKVI